MRFSVAAAGRALIMLTCAVGIPVLALSGTSWREAVQKVQDFHWPDLLKLAYATVTPAQNQPATLSIAGPTEDLDTRPKAWNQASRDTQTVVPVSYQTSNETSPIASSVALQETPGDPFETIPKRLQQLGATYYLLESWGSQQPMYRFYCKMAIGGSVDYTRCFEAVQSDPLQAMRQVLRQVESWHSGQN
ncbi:MAG: hypothetical protein LLF97_08125 [Planctomycetaceae bacterium]|nr:hypothetical protein [Planctomycetaceae bacterium]